MKTDATIFVLTVVAMTALGLMACESFLGYGDLSGQITRAWSGFLTR